MRASDQRLLGRLAELSWFTSNGEVAATRALVHMLGQRAFRKATLDYLTRRSGVDVTAVVRFLGEQVNTDGNRPDIDGLAQADAPLVVIEAKFAAAMPQEQVSGYFLNQRHRLDAPCRQ